MADNLATWYQVWSARDGSVFFNRWYHTDDAVTESGARVTVPRLGWGTYVWYVRGWGLDGLGSWSDPGEFVCGRPTPLSGAATQLAWDDADKSAADWYRVWINDVTGGGRDKERAWWFNRDTTTDLGGGNRSVLLAPTLAPGDYEWSIRAWSSAHGTGPWSDTQTFRVPVNSSTGSVAGVYSMVPEPANTEPPLPGVVAAVVSGQDTHILTVNGAWIRDPADFSWQGTTPNEGDTITVQGTVTEWLSLYGVPYKEIEVSQP